MATFTSLIHNYDLVAVPVASVGGGVDSVSELETAAAASLVFAPSPDAAPAVALVGDATGVGGFAYL